MKLYVILLVVVALACVLEVRGTREVGEVSCSSCGRECQAACGTRHFRACCFNFQRRRRADPRLQLADKMGSGDPDSDPTPSLADPGRVPYLAAYILQDAAQEKDQDGAGAAEGGTEPLQEARGSLPLRGVAQFPGQSASPRMGSIPSALSFPQLLRLIRQY